MSEGNDEPTPQYEYTHRVITGTSPFDANEWATRLDALGWECYSIIAPHKDSMTLFFKRRRNGS
jgi:hypothetical protein